jgi:hypothetical protein
MTAITWAELSHRKVSYVCNHGIENWEYCRAIASHLRWEAQAEQWMIALFVGTAFILLSVAASIVLADRRPRAAAPNPAPRAGHGPIMLALRRWTFRPAPGDYALA